MKQDSWLPEWKAFFCRYSKEEYVFPSLLSPANIGQTPCYVPGEWDQKTRDVFHYSQPGFSVLRTLQEMRFVPFHQERFQGFLLLF